MTTINLAPKTGKRQVTIRSFGFLCFAGDPSLSAVHFLRNASIRERELARQGHIIPERPPTALLKQEDVPECSIPESAVGTFLIRHHHSLQRRQFALIPHRADICMWVHRWEKIHKGNKTRFMCQPARESQVESKAKCVLSL